MSEQSDKPQINIEDLSEEALDKLRFEVKNKWFYLYQFYIM